MKRGIIRCKDITDLLSELYDNELERDIEELMFDHIFECERCHTLFSTFERMLDMFHSLEPVKLERVQKIRFHKWLKVEIKRIVIKRRGRFSL